MKANNRESHERVPGCIPGGTPDMACTLERRFFYHVLSGRKNVEGRLWRGKWAAVDVGMVLEMVCGPMRLAVVVTGVRRYVSFVEYLEREGLDRTLPGTATVDLGVDTYRSLYSRDDEVAHGVVAVEFQCLVR